jgi:NAD(P)-dependent dehydrogenase (short-subunit alcohol dehydrogenase family)
MQKELEMKLIVMILITGRRQAELDKAAVKIGSNVTAVKGDVANPNDLDRLYQTIAAKKGKLDILFANAGIADPVADIGRFIDDGKLPPSFRQCLPLYRPKSRWN